MAMTRRAERSYTLGIDPIELRLRNHTEVIRSPRSSGVGLRPTSTYDVDFVGTPDTVRPIGIEGIGEIDVIGVSAAIANAVYHATGRLIRCCRSPLNSCCEPDEHMTRARSDLAASRARIVAAADDERRRSARPGRRRPAAARQHAAIPLTG
jgi:hypothetical protein